MSLFKKAVIACLALTLALGSLTIASAEPGGRPDKEGKERFAQETPVPTGTPAKPGFETKEQKKEEKAEQKELRGAASLAKRHGIVGTLAAKSSGSITVSTKFGSIDIVVNADTKFKVPGKSNATLNDIPVNARVAVQVTRNGSTATAVAIHLVPGKPQRAHRVGKVTDVSATSITVQDKKGESTTFTLTADTKFLPDGTKPVVGDVVTVVANRIPSDTNWTAKAVVIHKPETK